MEYGQMGLICPICSRLLDDAGVEGYPCHGAYPPADYKRSFHQWPFKHSFKPTWSDPVLSPTLPQ